MRLVKVEEYGLGVGPMKGCAAGSFKCDLRESMVEDSFFDSEAVLENAKQ
jgi:hypothetical protein